MYATGQAVLFSDRAVIYDMVRRTRERSGGIRTLLHEVVASPFFSGDRTTIEEPGDRDTKQRRDAVMQAHRMLMTAVLSDIASPVQRTATPVQEPAPREYQFDNASNVTVQVTGLFMPERVDDFRKLMHLLPDAKLQSIDFKSAAVTMSCAANSDLFRNATPEQITERLNNRIRQLSGHVLGVKPLSTIPREKLELVEISITGLDCKACSLAVYEVLARIEGVEQATASFRDSRATAWIDPARTNRAAIEEALKGRGVTLGTH